MYFRIQDGKNQICPLNFRSLVIEILILRVSEILSNNFDVI